MLHAVAVDVHARIVCVQFQVRCPQLQLIIIGNLFFFGKEPLFEHLLFGTFVMLSCSFCCCCRIAGQNQRKIKRQVKTCNDTLTVENIGWRKKMRQIFSEGHFCHTNCIFCFESFPWYAFVFAPLSLYTEYSCFVARITVHSEAWLCHNYRQSKIKLGILMENWRHSFHLFE